MAIPPRSPDFNPIENIFYLVKRMLQYGKPIVAIFNTEIQFQFNKIQVQFNENSTSILLENNLSSRSNVSSAVKRARSMLQRSRSTGLCSCLSQQKRLRSASPSVHSNNRGKKQKTSPEQSKPFEFALMYEGEADDDKENLSINHDNILL